LVRDCVVGMSEGCGGSMPITVKCRIGTDLDYRFTKTGYEEMDNDEVEYNRLREFIETVASSGVVTDFQIHARIAVLNRKFSPADNRKIPQLKYGLVGRLVEEYPELTFSLNGGVESLGDVRSKLEEYPGLKGVMVGRAWAANPWSFGAVDDVLYGEEGSGGGGERLVGGLSRPMNRLEVLKEYGRHADAEEALWDPIKIRRFIVKAVQPLFAGEANAKKYRIALDEIAGRPKKLAAQGLTLEGQLPLSELILGAAIEHLSEEALGRTAGDSYLMEEDKKRGGGGSGDVLSNGIGDTVLFLGGDGGNSQIVRDWQTRRKEEEGLMMKDKEEGL